MGIQVSEAGSPAEEKEVTRKVRTERRAIEGTEATEKKGLKDPPAHQAEIPEAAGNAASWKLRILPNDLWASAGHRAPGPFLEQW